MSLRVYRRRPSVSGTELISRTTRLQATKLAVGGQGAIPRISMEGFSTKLIFAVFIQKNVYFFEFCLRCNYVSIYTNSLDFLLEIQ